MKKFYIFTFSLLTAVVFFGCSEKKPSSSEKSNQESSKIIAPVESKKDTEYIGDTLKETSTVLEEKVIEITSKPKDEIKIGYQVWSSKNLNIEKFRNGDPIPQAKTAQDWVIAGQNKQPAWCYYNNVAKNGSVFGKLYNWYAVNDPRGLAPAGWRIPIDSEWGVLLQNVGIDAGLVLKSTKTWLEDGNGTNHTGFSGLSSGYRTHEGIFMDMGKEGSYWSANEAGDRWAWRTRLESKSSAVQRLDLLKSFGFSVRCLKE